MLRRWWWVFLVMAVAGSFLGFIGAAAVSYVMPKKYQSVAVVQVAPERPQMAPDGGAEPVHSMPSRFLATEMEVIRAEKTLERVVEELDLPLRWGVGRGQATGMVREMMELEPIRGTDLIEIRVRHMNAEDARDIALETAKAYRDRRAEFGRERAVAELAALSKVLREQEERVEASRREFYGILDSMGIARDADSGGEDGDSPDDSVARQRYLAAQQEYEAGRAQLEEMRIETQAKRIGLELPRSPVVIHEEPVLAGAPVSPNLRLNLLLGLVAGVPIGLLLALPLILVADRSAGRKG